MLLENIALDALDPARLGAFWEALLDGTRLTDTPDLVETRLGGPDGPWLDLCVPRVPEAPRVGPRLHLDLVGGEHQEAVVTRALGLGARPLDIGQGEVPWVVLADPEGNPFCVMEHRPEYLAGAGIAALPLDSADPERDLRFYAALTGWRPDPVSGSAALRHPSGLGPLLELLPEPRPKDPAEKNRLHLDVRLEPGEHLDDAVALALDLGGSELDHGWGDLPWRVLRDPSGNEVCILPAASG